MIFVLFFWHAKCSKGCTRMIFQNGTRVHENFVGRRILIEAFAQSPAAVAVAVYNDGLSAFAIRPTGRGSVAISGRSTVAAAATADAANGGAHCTRTHANERERIVWLGTDGEGRGDKVSETNESKETSANGGGGGGASSKPEWKAVE